jgi:hypothetical protein
MPKELLDYLFVELKDHLERLKDESYKDSPDGESVEYHFEKASEIINMIQKGNKSSLD